MASRSISETDETCVLGDVTHQQELYPITQFCRIRTYPNVV